MQPARRNVTMLNAHMSHINLFTQALGRGTTPDTNWMDEAACRSVDPEIFFPEGRGVQPTKALEVCATCPVQAECLIYGEREQYGVYGGITPNQRGAPRNVRQDHGVREWLRA